MQVASHRPKFQIMFTFFQLPSVKAGDLRR
jgi:hypothetical protein